MMRLTPAELFGVVAGKVCGVSSTLSLLSFEERSEGF
jgi:uncharacterized protein YgfB (UPF0149 family)